MRGGDKAKASRRLCCSLTWLSFAQYCQCLQRRFVLQATQEKAHSVKLHNSTQATVAQSTCHHLSVLSNPYPCLGSTASTVPMSLPSLPSSPSVLYLSIPLSALSPLSPFPRWRDHDFKQTISALREPHFRKTGGQHGFVVSWRCSTFCSEL